MAIETEVDKLVLGIEVNDKTDGESASKKISSLTKSLNRLQKTVTNFDTTNFNTTFKSMATAVKPFISQLKEAENSITALSNVMKMTGKGGLSKVLGSSTVQDIVAKPTGQEVSSDEMQNTQNGASDILEESTETISKGTSKILVFAQALKKIVSRQKDVNKESDKASKGGLKRFFNSIKRIAMYRLIRSFLKELAQGLRDGINNLAGYSSEFNTTMSNITSQITILKNSVALIGSSLVEALDPIITSFTQSFGNFANAISYVTAKLKGESTYLKVNLDYWKEYNKQANLLSFDSFSTLTKNDTSDMYETASIDDEESTESFAGLTDIAESLVGLFTTLGNILSKVLSILGKIATSDAFKGMCTSITDALNWLSKLLDDENVLYVALVALASILGVIAVANLLVALTNPFTWAAIAVVAFIAEIAVLIKYWDTIWGKIKECFQAVVTWITNRINDINNFISWIVGIAATVKTVITEAWQSIKNMFKNVATTVITWFTNVISKVKAIFTKVGNALSAFFSNIGIAIANVFIGIVNWIIKCINAILTPINKVAELFGKSVQISSIEYISFKAFAEGGFPDTGQLFVARESGAEMVGSMNGRTAVANNDQIVTGIQQGVYNAMMAVLSQNKSNGEMYVYIDGTKAGRVVESAVYNEGVRVGHFKRR